MDRETLSKLRLDRRLLQRRGWISPDDLEHELEALPDVSGKIARDDEHSSEPAPPASPEARGEPGPRCGTPRS